MHLLVDSHPTKGTCRLFPLLPLKHQAERCPMERLWHLPFCAPRSKPAQQVCSRKPAQPCDGADVCWQLLQPSAHGSHQLSVLRLSGLALNLCWSGSNGSCLRSSAAVGALGRSSPVCNDCLCSAMVLRSDACSRITVGARFSLKPLTWLI